MPRRGRRWKAGVSAEDDGGHEVQRDEGGRRCSPSVGVDHDNVAMLAPAGQQAVGELVRALVDLSVREDTLRAPGAPRLDDTLAVRVCLGVGSEDVVDGCRVRRTSVTESLLRV